MQTDDLYLMNRWLHYTVCALLENATNPAILLLKITETVNVSIRGTTCPVRELIDINFHLLTNATAPSFGITPMIVLEKGSYAKATLYCYVVQSAAVPCWMEQ